MDERSLQVDLMHLDRAVPMEGGCRPRALCLHPSPAPAHRQGVHGCGRPLALLGWEFSLMVATVRLINSGLLDELPSLKIQVAHFGGGIARYLPRISGLQNREKSGTAQVPRHSRMPRKPFDHYLQHRLFYDCAGWSGPDCVAKRGTEWVRMGLAELPSSQLVFATDYPQAVRDDEEVVAYVNAVRALGLEARTVLDGINAKRLIPNLKRN